ncbi:hypothetical protein D9757_010312 [Collybiopsis confluens]|uniref:Uncharacterized protein n=1 Tax=Collybiopsis confluens TaxID=2823264 RepID=A0A8H5GUF2_9AGAR|nr:hypothetical protein D9757_010312 [Collybiopsis confluens]
MDELNKEMSTLKARNNELERELDALKEKYHSVEEKRRMYRRKYRALKDQRPSSSVEISLIKQEKPEFAPFQSASGEKSHGTDSGGVKVEPSDERQLEKDDQSPGGVIIEFYDTGSRHSNGTKYGARIGLEIAAISVEGVEFRGESTHEAEQFILRRLIQAASLDDKKWTSRGICVLDHRSIVWLGSSNEHGLVLVPKTQSCPQYSLLSPHDSFSGQTRELFVRKRDSLHYTGSYVCGDAPAGMGMGGKAFRGDRGTVTDLMAQACYEIQTQSESDWISVADFEALCDDGKIRAEWISFRCVGFDQMLCDAFTRTSESEEVEMIEGSQGGREGTSGVGRKRKRLKVEADLEEANTKPGTSVPLGPTVKKKRL